MFPRPLTTFVGRQSECRLLRASVVEYPLSTVVGPPGVGKTTNAGPSSATGVTLADVLPRGLTVRSVAAAEPFDCEVAGRRIDCAAAALPVGEYRLVIAATVDDGASGSLGNTARVRAETKDPNRGNNADSATLTVTEEPGGGGGGGGGGDGELPQTGGGRWPLDYAFGALGLAVAGAVLMLLGRRITRNG